MSIEDIALRFEGLDPVRVKAILDSVEHLLGVAQAEMPRFAKLLTDIKTEIAAYEAKQRGFK